MRDLYFQVSKVFSLLGLFKGTVVSYWKTGATQLFYLILKRHHPTPHWELIIKCKILTCILRAVAWFMKKPRAEGTRSVDTLRSVGWTSDEHLRFSGAGTGPRWAWACWCRGWPRGTPPWPRRRGRTTPGSGSSSMMRTRDALSTTISSTSI